MSSGTLEPKRTPEGGCQCEASSDRGSGHTPPLVARSSNATVALVVLGATLTNVTSADEARTLSDIPLFSLGVILDQVASERETMNTHAESLDTKAAVVLGFSGVLVGLGATAQTSISSQWAFEIGLALGVAAAFAAALAFLPRKYPVVEVLPLRDLLTAPEEETRLKLLDAQINMVIESAALVKHKGRRVKAAVGLLAVAAALIVAGTLVATGGTQHARRSADTTPAHTSPGTASPAGAATLST
jgi:hypothetical protein